MKKFTKCFNLLMISLLFTGFTCMAQSSAENAQIKMKTYVIERSIPGAGQFSPEKLRDISRSSCTVLKEMGPGIEWLHSYVVEDKFFCIYKAENIELIKEHAKRGGFPVTAIYEVSSVISPKTAQE